jgi:hypothetical protein
MYIFLTFPADDVDQFLHLVLDEMGIYAYNIGAIFFQFKLFNMVRIDKESDVAEMPENGCMVEDGVIQV